MCLPPVGSDEVTLTNSHLPCFQFLDSTGLWLTVVILWYLHFGTLVSHIVISKHGAMTTHENTWEVSLISCLNCLQVPSLNMLLICIVCRVLETSVTQGDIFQLCLWILPSILHAYILHLAFCLASYISSYMSVCWLTVDWTSRALERSKSQM